MLIDGKWISRPGEPVLNPADESEVATLPHCTEADLAEGVESAEKGFRVWRRTPPAKRAEVILDAVRLIRERIEEIAVVLTMENGKTLRESRLEVLRAVSILEWDATEGRRLYGRIIPSEPGMRHTVLRQPIGVVLAFTPWNFPFTSPARKIGGALSAGCSIIIKASSETPGGAMKMCQAFADAGIPPGVINLILGKSDFISDYLIPQPVRLVTLTGSTPIGKRLAAVAANYMKPVIMELGGHAPVVVCEDADPGRTATMAIGGKSRNSGQVCVSPTRFFVHESIYKKFSQSFAEKAAALKVGNGLDPSTQMGPVANARRIAAMERLVSDAKKRGAKVLSGGSRIEGRGYHYPLTVIADVQDDALAMHEEPFGPLALLSPFRHLDEAIEKANSLPYGLAGYAFTNSSSYAYRLSEEIDVGNLSINHFVASIAETPFGGVKESGYGREGGVEGLECYTVVKNVSHLMEIQKQ